MTKDEGAKTEEGGEGREEGGVRRKNGGGKRPGLSYTPSFDRHSFEAPVSKDKLPSAQSNSNVKFGQRLPTQRLGRDYPHNVEATLIFDDPWGTAAQLGPKKWRMPG